MQQNTVIYRGVTVVDGWPQLIDEAQSITTCQPNGITTPRVRYGDETEDWGADGGPCHDCAAIKGELHVPGCDVERCPSCGGQSATCDCEWPDVGERA